METTYELPGFDTPRDRWIALGILLAVCALILAAVFYGGRAALQGLLLWEENRATGECMKWQEDARVYPAYFLAPWQAEQCATYGIAIDAPVVDYSKQN